MTSPASVPGAEAGVAPLAAPLAAPAPDPLRRPVPRQFLELVSRPLLVRLLSDHARDLEALHAFPLAALAASAQTDRAHVEALWTILGAPAPELIPLRDDLLAVADVATRTGHELLLASDSERVLDHELGAEDCAALARLEHRALFDKTRPQTAGQAQTKSFASFQSSSPRPYPSDPACRVALEKRMGTELEARGRSDYFRVYEWRSGSERHLELVYGRLASARTLLGKTVGGAHDVTGQVTDRSTERARAVFHDDTLRFDIAGYDWMKELVRRVFGETYFGSATHFEGDETITLAPLADLQAALSADGIPGLKKVELQEMAVLLGGPTGAWVAVGARGDCLAGPAAVYALRALTEGAPSSATFHLFLTGRTRPVKLKLLPPRKLEFDRRDARVVRVVRDWVVGRGFMGAADYLRTSETDGVVERDPSDAELS